MKQIPMPPTAMSPHCLQVNEDLYINFAEPGIFWAEPTGVFTSDPPAGLYFPRSTLGPFTAPRATQVTLYFFDFKDLTRYTWNVTIQQAPCPPVKHRKPKKRKLRKP